MKKISLVFSLVFLGAGIIAGVGGRIYNIDAASPMVLFNIISSLIWMCIYRSLRNITTL